MKKLWTFYQVEEYYQERLKTGTWPGYFSIEQVLEALEEILQEDGLSKSDAVWELPNGHEKYMDRLNKKRYDRAMKGI